MEASGHCHAPEGGMAHLNSQSENFFEAGMVAPVPGRCVVGLRTPVSSPAVNANGLRLLHGALSCHRVTTGRERQDAEVTASSHGERPVIPGPKEVRGREAGEGPYERFYGDACERIGVMLKRTFNRVGQNPTLASPVVL